MPSLALKPARMLTFVPHRGKPSPSARCAHHNLPIPQGWAQKGRHTWTALPMRCLMRRHLFSPDLEYHTFLSSTTTAICALHLDSHSSVSFPQIRTSSSPKQALHQGCVGNREVRALISNVDPWYSSPEWSICPFWFLLEGQGHLQKPCFFTLLRQ